LGSVVSKCDTQAFLVNAFKAAVVNDAIVSNDISALWDLEAIGIKYDSFKQCDSVAHDNAMSHFVQNVEFVENRYQVRLPFREENVDQLGNNLAVAQKRLKGLANKLKSTDDLIQRYNDGVSQLILNGNAEPVAPPGNKLTNYYYMPHRAVLRENHESTKLRIV